MTEAAEFALVLSKLTALVAGQKQLLGAINNRLSYRTLKTMANTGLQNAQAAVAALQALQVTVIAELQALQSAVGDPDATVQTLADQINASVAAIQAAIPSAPPAG